MTSSASLLTATRTPHGLYSYFTNLALSVGSIIGSDLRIPSVRDCLVIQFARSFALTLGHKISAFCRVF